jgi:hypothetical protein
MEECAALLVSYLRSMHHASHMQMRITRTRSRVLLCSASIAACLAPSDKCDEHALAIAVTMHMGFNNAEGCNDVSSYYNISECFCANCCTKQKSWWQCVWLLRASRMRYTRCITLMLERIECDEHAVVRTPLFCERLVLSPRSAIHPRMHPPENSVDTAD